MIEFLRPWALLVLPLPMLAWWFLSVAAPSARVRTPESVLTLMRAIQGNGSRRVRVALPLALLSAGWIALVAALAGPVSSLGNLIRPSGHDIVIAIDLSASMGRRDDTGRTTAFDRFREAVANYLDQLPSGDRAALIVFGEQAYLIAPLTHDAAALSGYLDELTVGMPGRKTSVGVAVGLALKVFDSGESAQRTLMVLSDGEDNAGDLPAPAAALLARDRGVVVHAVGIKDAESSGGGSVLRQVAETTGGTFSTLTDGGVLPAGRTEQDRDVVRTSPLPLKRLWSSELVLFAALMFTALTLMRARRQ
jgi:Ca-activated chloride channel family protein